MSLKETMRIETSLQNLPIPQSAVEREIAHLKLEMLNLKFNVFEMQLLAFKQSLIKENGENK